MIRGISGLVVEYVVAIDVTWVRFPADALFGCLFASPLGTKKLAMTKRSVPSRIRTGVVTATT